MRIRAWFLPSEDHSNVRSDLGYVVGAEQPLNAATHAATIFRSSSTRTRKPLVLRTSTPGMQELRVTPPFPALVGYYLWLWFMLAPFTTRTGPILVAAGPVEILRPLRYVLLRVYRPVTSHIPVLESVFVRLKVSYRPLPISNH